MNYQKSNFDLDLDAYDDMDFDDQPTTRVVEDQFDRLIAEQNRKRAERKLLTPEEIHEIEEKERLKSVRRILGRPRGDEKDEQQMYNLLTQTPDTINYPIDGLANSIVHYVANPTRLCVFVDGEWETRQATDRQREALEGWQEIVIMWCKPDAFLPNVFGLSAIDLASEFNTATVKLLCMSDENADQLTKDKAIARACLMSAQGLCVECDAYDDEIFDALKAIQGILDEQMDFFVPQCSMLESMTWKQKIKQIKFSPDLQPRINGLLIGN